MKKNPMFPAFKSGLATLLVVSAMLVGCGPKEKPVQPGVEDSPSYVASARTIGEDRGSSVDRNLTFEYDINNKIIKLESVVTGNKRTCRYAYNAGKLKSMTFFINDIQEIITEPVYVNDKATKYIDTYASGNIYETSLTYNANNQISTVYSSFNGSSVNYTYDLENNITQIFYDSQTTGGDYTLSIEYDKNIKNPAYNPEVLIMSQFDLFITGLNINGTYFATPSQKYVIKSVKKDGVLLNEYNYSTDGKKLIRTKIGGSGTFNFTTTIERK